MKPTSDLMVPFRRIAAEIEPGLAWRAKTPAEHGRWRRRFVRKLRELVGRSPEPVPLEVEWSERREERAFVRHKIYVRTEKDYWAPAYYYVPKELKAPAPAIVCLHGHRGINPYIGEGSAEELKQSKDLNLAYAPFFAERGYVTSVPIQRGWNETARSVNPDDKPCDRLTMNSFFVGMTPVGLRAWDASRIVDFLETRDEVDPKRIGAAGLSGGGMVGLFWTALERRVRLAMIAGYYCTFRDSIYSIHHCQCNCVPRIMQWAEMREVAALVAPRPMLVISGLGDPIFPIKATRKAYRELRRVYEVLGASGNLASDFFDGPHAWSNRKTLAFLAKHFTRNGAG